MTRFRFGLQKVLELREQVEQNMAIELNIAVSSEKQARQNLEALEIKRANGIESIQGSTSHTAGELLAHGLVMEHLDMIISDAFSDLVNAQQSVQEAQERLTSAHQERRVLDNLKEKQHAQHLHSTNQQDRDIMDEIAVLRYGKQQV